MRTLTLALMLLLIPACSDRDDDDGSGDPAQDGGIATATQALYSGGYPPFQLLFNVGNMPNSPTQATWDGTQAGQPYTRWQSGSSVPGQISFYNEWDDGLVNLNIFIGLSPSVCYKASQTKVICFAYEFNCPATPIIGDPRAWRNSSSEPWHFESVAPWKNAQWITPLGNPTISFGASGLVGGGTGTAIFCKYPAPSIQVMR